MLIRRLNNMILPLKPTKMLRLSIRIMLIAIIILAIFIKLCKGTMMQLKNMMKRSDVIQNSWMLTIIRLSL